LGDAMDQHRGIFELIALQFFSEKLGALLQFDNKLVIEGCLEFRCHGNALFII